jgi:hypothetical protein
MIAQPCTYVLPWLPLRDSTAAFADKALRCTALLKLPNHDCFLLSFSVRDDEPSSDASESMLYTTR